MKKDWITTTKRFVAFFDILGFKDIVERNSHFEVVAKLKQLKLVLAALEQMSKRQSFTKTHEISQTKSITFSDSIIIFSESDTGKDASKIIMDSTFLISRALEIGLGIKGAISYGEVTVDYENSLFFGRPIIDAFLLHDQLHLYSAILDNHFEKKIQDLTVQKIFSDCIQLYKTNIKSGKVYHKLICPPKKTDVEREIEFTKKLYESVSGTPRIYVDNTLDFLNFVLTQKNK